MNQGELVRVNRGKYKNGGLIMDMDDPRTRVRLDPGRAFWFEMDQVGLILELGEVEVISYRTHERSECQLVKVLCPSGVGYFSAKEVDHHLEVVGENEVPGAVG